MFCLNARAHVPHKCQKRAPDSLELELQTVVSNVGAGNDLRSSERTVNTLYH